MKKLNPSFHTSGGVGGIFGNVCNFIIARHPRIKSEKFHRNPYSFYRVIYEHKNRYIGTITRKIRSVAKTHSLDGLWPEIDNPHGSIQSV